MVQLNKEKNLKAKAKFGVLILETIKSNVRNELLEVILKIFNSPHLLLKVYLFVCVIISIGLASYMIIQSIMSYFSFEVITTTRTIFEIPTLFPKVTLCNLNPFTTNFAFEYLKEFDETNSFFVKESNLDFYNTLLFCL